MSSDKTVMWLLLAALIAGLGWAGKELFGPLLKVIAERWASWLAEVSSNYSIPALILVALTGGDPEIKGYAPLDGKRYRAIDVVQHYLDSLALVGRLTPQLRTVGLLLFVLRIVGPVASHRPVVGWSWAVGALIFVLLLPVERAVNRREMIDKPWRRCSLALGGLLQMAYSATCIIDSTTPMLVVFWTASAWLGVALMISAQRGGFGQGTRVLAAPAWTAMVVSIWGLYPITFATSIVMTVLCGVIALIAYDSWNAKLADDS